MLRNLASVPIRVVVTGARGKSSLTRLLHAGLAACGLKVCARITGVLPRALFSPPYEERVIRRASPANIGEMRWWLGQIPGDTQAIVVENSAVAPELQNFAARLLSPTLAIWTTVRPDHIEAWGPGREGAARTLIRGIPAGIPVAGGPDLLRPPLPELLRGNGNALHTPDVPEDAEHNEANRALALLACGLCMPGFDKNAVFSALESLPPDMADFRILENGGDELAVAFSANEPESTELLFRETGWNAHETSLLYHHRPDRIARLDGFLPWIASRAWREVAFTRSDRPFFSSGRGIVWNDAVDSPDAFRRWWKGRGRVFACGNVAGWPMKFLEEVRIS